MEDDIEKNGRQPQKIWKTTLKKKWKTTLKKMEEEKNY
jgi:hypothetical protein